MLVLSRRRRESIVIGDNVEVSIVKIDGSHVQLGITAPKDIPVYRKEVFLAIQSENTGASQSTLQDLTKAFSSFKKKK